MKIYTKKGDTGETSLMGGKRVAKNDVRIDSYGTVDELNSWIGLLRDQNIAEESWKELIEIQDRLFTIGSILATAPEGTKMKLPELKDEDIQFLEECIDRMNESLPEMKSFVLPGGNTTVSYSHIARCVCRRAERLVVALNDSGEDIKRVMKYLNRLSDYLFVLARKLTQDTAAEETPWKPRI
ncbi:MAG: cob(I)yrinic acid a,c-diamide adenosyltransferase [Brumimicrobium sp.]|nr:cob(I)yrinic acid a,c-diamide adenosyltransferase [Brumimicrobium sp.]